MKLPRTSRFQQSSQRCALFLCSFCICVCVYCVCVCLINIKLSCCNGGCHQKLQAIVKLWRSCCCTLNKLHKNKKSRMYNDIATGSLHFRHLIYIYLHSHRKAIDISVHCQTVLPFCISVAEQLHLRDLRTACALHVAWTAATEALSTMA